MHPTENYCSRVRIAIQCWCRSQVQIIGTRKCTKRKIETRIWTSKTKCLTTQYRITGHWLKKNACIGKVVSFLRKLSEFKNINSAKKSEKKWNYRRESRGSPPGHRRRAWIGGLWGWCRRNWRWKQPRLRWRALLWASKTRPLWERDSGEVRVVMESMKEKSGS